MNRIFLSLLALLVLLFSNNAMATFTKAEIAAVQPLVNELMGDFLRDYKARKISGSEVGDNALKLADEAESDVAKFICMKGAISYYARDKAYDKAADTIELMMSKFKDMPPETLLEIISSATSRATDKSASRLFEIRKAVNIKIASSKKIRALKAQLDKTPADKRLICRYAELMAVENKWDEALKMFAKMGGDLGKISQDTLNGSASSVQIAEFWWDYKAKEEDAKDAIRLYSIKHYQNAIDKGELVGLKKTLAEKRIAECDGKSEQSVRQTNNITSSRNGLIHRWRLNRDLKDSIGGRDGKAVEGNVLFRNGQVRIQPGGGYVDLGANVVPGGGEAEFTIEIWATKYSIQNWARVFQIPNNWGRNDFYWSWNHGTTKNKWQWKVSGYGVWNRWMGDGTGENEECHFVIVYGHDAEKFPYFGVYLLRKGGIYWERSERLGGKMFDTHSAFWLGHGDGDRADASYNEVRIWNRVLTKDEILKSTKLGPDRLP